MSNYNGILLLSDWDGTLCYDGHVSDENIEAINYFVKNGGIFTICSGRSLKYISEKIKNLSINTFLISYNGAYIASIDGNNVLYKKICQPGIYTVIREIFTTGDEYKEIILSPVNDSGPIVIDKDSFLKNYDTLKENKIYKAVFVAKNDHLGDLGAERVQALNIQGYSTVRSWRSSLEILDSENTKGAALKRLAKHCKSKMTVAVGDYENDISMIKAATIGYATENATDKVKQFADKITVSCDKSVIAAIIKDLNNTFCL